MPRLAFALLGLAVLGTPAAAPADEKLERAAVRLEHNATDEDVEVVFEATSGDHGFTGLRVTAPDGRTVIDFRAADSKLGIRHLVLESPERVNDGRVQAEFPAGAYSFAGTTSNGEKLAGKATLSHALPAAASFVRPRPKEKGVAVSGLRLQWSGPKGLASYMVAVENEETGVKVLQATLPGTATAFAVPDGLLAPGTEYKVEIGTVAPSGNRTFVEAAFTTAGKK